MAIDLNGSTTYTASELKARSMSRMQEQGLGYPELIALLLRAVYALRGEYTLDVTTDAQITEIGKLIMAEEQAYKQETLDNDLLKETLDYEAAQSVASSPAPEPELDEQGAVVNQQAIDNHAEAVLQAINVINSATTAVIYLFNVRRAKNV